LAYATFWRRVGGYLIDALIIAVPTVAAFFILFGSTFSSWVNQVSTAAQNGLTAPKLVLPFNGLVAYGVFDCVLAALYFGILVGIWGSTVGQRAVGVRVVRQEDTSTRLPLERALLRAIIWWGPGLVAFVPGVSTIAELVVLLAVLWVAWDPRKQGLHDKLGRALVVRRETLVPVAPYGQPQYPYGLPPAPSPYPPQYPPAPPTVP
jgi:uncharacterized RDD family membrane protein YckC